MCAEGPPKPDETAVIRRALALCLLLQRAEFESMAQDPDVEEARQVHTAMARRVTVRLHGEGLWDDVPEREKPLMAQPPGTWTSADVDEAHCLGDHLAALLWALSIADMPPWDTSADVEAQIRMIQPPEGTSQPLRSGALRHEDEVRAMLSAAAAWVARANTRLITDLSMDLTRNVDLKKLVGEAAASAHANGYAGEPIGGDFPALGRAYRDLDEAQFRSVHLVAVQRLRALNWLLGREESSIPSSPGARTSTAGPDGRAP